MGRCYRSSDRGGGLEPHASAGPARAPPAVLPAAARPPAAAWNAAPLPARAGRGSRRSSRPAATRRPRRPRTQGTPQGTSLLSYARDAMCFDVDSEPPIPRISGAAVSHDDLVLESEDGNRFAAFRAVPEAGSVTGQAGDARLGDRGAEGAAGGEISTGVVILPDVRGLYRFYEELALRFAERGHAAIAFDYFGRTAGIDKRPDDWDYMPLVQQLTHEQVQADVGACVRDLRELGCDAIFTVGFCFGGSGSWAAAAWGHGLAGAVGFYGRPGRMIDLVPKLDAPILALQGGADQGIPHEDNVAFEQALRDAGKAYELIEFEGAPHSFFDRKQEEFQAASDAAWRRTLDFIATYS